MFPVVPARRIAALTLVLLLFWTMPVCLQSHAVGLIAPVPRPPLKAKAVYKSALRLHAQAGRQKQARARRKAARAPRQSAARAPRAGISLPDVAGALKSSSVAPGVLHRSYLGALRVNVIDVDMVHAPVCVRPVLASDCSSRGLCEVKNQVRDRRAVAAVNANYFKKDGTPLGTLIMNGEWIAGPLYDRVSMGVTRSGYVRVDRVNLHGMLETSNPQAACIWVNNVNQPRRTGARLVAYTRRWGASVRLPYAAAMVAVDGDGVVVDSSKTVRSMGIPLGGFVLTDRKEGAIARLVRGDRVSLRWETRPKAWGDVVSAVSGGPMLVRGGQLYLDLKSEGFRGGWAGAGIKARTAAGVTWNNHLLLVTVEGPHTLWDMAKFMHRLGAVDAMNLDGGGSTTMVVNGRTVTRNGNSYQRRVANSLAVLLMPAPASTVCQRPNDFSPPVSYEDIDAAAAACAWAGPSAQDGPTVCRQASLAPLDTPAETTIGVE